MVSIVLALVGALVPAAVLPVAGPGPVRAPAGVERTGPPAVGFERPAPLAAVYDPPFQQRVEYRIEAALDEATQVLRGRARLRYENRSPDALDTLYFHQHLNAFRPNSAWARRDLEAGERRFQDLGPEDHAFERLLSAVVDGVAAAPVYPGAPDSTVFALPLASPIPPGGIATVELDWEARLATEYRRQGRRGRHYDWAHWYPRIAVYDTAGWRYRAHLRQGEFFGEFGRYDVTLEVAADQVVAASGVPVEGDPGWRSAAAPGSEAPLAVAAPAGLGTAEPLGLLAGEPAAGRKRVRWVAEDVHHFAWAADPDFVYEGGAWNGIPIHVLYMRADTVYRWGGGTMVERAASALEWIHRTVGPYPYPHLVVSQRLDGGATEFPMMFMGSSGSQGLTVHEVAHIYFHAAVANNEWREGWLDEGLADFLTHAYWEARGNDTIWAGPMTSATLRERAGRTQPIALPAAEFADFRAYQAFTYTKPMLVFRMLRWYLGEERFGAGLRSYYEENRFRHVTEADLRRAFENAAGEDLDWFFDQWIHTTATLDYRVGVVETRAAEGGGWITTVEVLREGDAWMPVELKVGDAGRRLDSRERRQVVEVRTAERPPFVVLDPEWILLDLDPRNNGRRL